MLGFRGFIVVCSVFLKTDMGYASLKHLMWLSQFISVVLGIKQRGL